MVADLKIGGAPGLLPVTLQLPYAADPGTLTEWLLRDIARALMPNRSKHMKSESTTPKDGSRYSSRALSWIVSSLQGHQRAQQGRRFDQADGSRYPLRALLSRTISSLLRDVKSFKNNEDCSIVPKDGSCIHWEALSWYILSLQSHQIVQKERRFDCS